MNRALLLPLLRPHPLVVADGLLQADEAVAVGVDLLELLVGAQKLPPRHVAVAVAVHLAEPQRPRRPRRRRTPHPPSHRGERQDAAVAPAPGGALAELRLVAARDLVLADGAVAV